MMHALSETCGSGCVMRMSDPSLFDDFPELSLTREATMKPALVRMLVDGFVRDTDPRSHGEIRQFEELMLNMLGEVDAFTRATIAHKLATRADAPRSVILQLAQDEECVCEPVLLHSPVLDDADRQRLAREGSPIARRILAGQPQAIAAVTSQIGRVRALLHAPAAAHTPDLMASLVGMLLPAPAPVASVDTQVEFTRSTSFLDLGEEERFAFLERIDLKDGSDSVPASEELVSQMVRHAALRQRAELYALTGRELMLPAAAAQMIFEDTTGALLIAACRVLGLPEMVLTQLLLLTNPAVAQSLQRLRRLRTAYREAGVNAARLAISELAAPRRAAPHHAGVVMDSTPARRTSESTSAQHGISSPGLRNVSGQ